jgi:peptide deformylase
MPFSVFVNPRIEVINPEQQGYWEGCLSVPGLRGKVYRPQHIALEYLDHNGDAQQMELQGFLATVFQHEFDHLHGKLYLDHIRDTTQLSFEAEFLEFELDR